MIFLYDWLRVRMKAADVTVVLVLEIYCSIIMLMIVILPTSLWLSNRKSCLWSYQLDYLLPFFGVWLFKLQWAYLYICWKPMLQKKRKRKVGLQRLNKNKIWWNAIQFCTKLCSTLNRVPSRHHATGHIVRFICFLLLSQVYCWFKIQDASFTSWPNVTKKSKTLSKESVCKFSLLHGFLPGKDSVDGRLPRASAFVNSTKR